MTTPPAHPTDPSGARRRRFRFRAAGALAALVWLMWSAPSKIATRNGG